MSQQHYRLTLEDAIVHYKKGWITATALLYYYLEIRLQNGWTTRELPQEIYKKLGFKKSAFYRAINQLVKEGVDLAVYGVEMSSPNNIEFLIRDRLQSQLGGLAEVKTPNGRIDLLTATEIVEVKQINDWKSALGQILAYSAFYPEHQKRLHLFGSPKCKNQIPEIANSCLPFNVLVTFESVDLATLEVEEG